MIAPKQATERIGRRLKLRDLRILMTVVECGTMGKAAERLSISQPVVSKAIADMEHALGVRLLDRSQRGVEPTPYGRALIKRGIAIFDEMRQGIEEIEFLSDPTAGEVRIGATDAINAAIVAPVIDRLSRTISADDVSCRRRRAGAAAAGVGGAQCGFRDFTICASRRRGVFGRNSFP